MHRSNSNRILKTLLSIHFAKAIDLPESIAKFVRKISTSFKASENIMKDATENLEVAIETPLTLSNYLANLPSEFSKFSESTILSIKTNSKNFKSAPIKSIISTWLDIIGKENLMALTIALTLVSLLLLTVYLANSQKASPDYLRSMNVVTLLSLFYNVFLFGTLFYFTSTDQSFKSELSDFLEYKILFFILLFFNSLMISFTILMNIKNRKVFEFKNYFIALGQFIMVVFIFTILRPLLNNIRDQSVRTAICFMLMTCSYVFSAKLVQSLKSGAKDSNIK